VVEIACQSGFEHPQFFNKLFKRKTSESPLEFSQSLIRNSINFSSAGNFPDPTPVIMNAYNEDLHNQVVNVLQNQALSRKNLAAQGDAAMFTLYDAQGARLSAAAVLQAARDEQVVAESIKEPAAGSNIDLNNLLLSAGAANNYLRQSVKNTAIAAFGVQIASNAVIRLASDIGSIYNLVQAGIAGNEMNDLAHQVMEVTNQTAYSAELASKHGMDVAVFTSKVSWAPVLTTSKLQAVPCLHY
jgi:hypothetical protein